MRPEDDNVNTLDKTQLFNFFTTVLVELVDKKIVLDPEGRNLFCDLLSKGELKPSRLLGHAGWGQPSFVDYTSREKRSVGPRQLNVELGSISEHPPLKIADAPGFWVVTSKTISVHAPITRLVGEIMDEDTGFEHYQRAAFEYSSLIIFNLGAEFQYSWFYIGNHVQEIQNKILPSHINPNCELIISKYDGSPVPIIVSTSNIPENTKLILANEAIKIRNHEYRTYRSEATVNQRISQRVRNFTTDARNEMYKLHVLIGTEEGLEPKHVSEEIGMGLFATKEFAEKDFIIEYRGELLSNEEGRKRFKKYPESDGSFMLELKYGIHGKQWIDGTKTPSIAKYVNHSVEPNSKMLCHTIDGAPRCFLIANRRITPGTQISFHYNDPNTTDFPFLKSKLD